MELFFFVSLFFCFFKKHLYWALQERIEGAHDYTHFEDEEIEIEADVGLVANQDHIKSRWQAWGGL